MTEEKEKGKGRGRGRGKRKGKCQLVKRAGLERIERKILRRKSNRHAILRDFVDLWKTEKDIANKRW